jgi:hypothetical protein
MHDLCTIYSGLERNQKNAPKPTTSKIIKGILVQSATNAQISAQITAGHKAQAWTRGSKPAISAKPPASPNGKARDQRKSALNKKLKASPPSSPPGTTQSAFLLQRCAHRHRPEMASNQTQTVPLPRIEEIRASSPTANRVRPMARSRGCSIIAVHCTVRLFRFTAP